MLIFEIETSDKDSLLFKDQTHRIVCESVCAYTCTQVCA